ncbi:hypothetical protein LCGC14_2551000 [marine sediment metagenome]|uniref:Uncharacterized protein n=1 Tax=marine sediment metagenome TaxID=412755 RepID=A0A0F9AMT4_9ZZZZ
MVSDSIGRIIQDFSPIAQLNTFGYSFVKLPDVSVSLALGRPVGGFTKHLASGHSSSMLKTLLSWVLFLYPT